MAFLFHAARSLLKKLDGAQDHYLRELDLSPAQAFLDFNFAPAALRRDVAVLGVLHKRVIGKCHPSYNRLLPWRSDRFPEPRELGHSKQLYVHSVEVSNHQAIFNRSIFGMVTIYNDLPQDVVDATSVGALQHKLMQITRTRCQAKDADWALSFRKRLSHDDPDPY